MRVTYDAEANAAYIQLPDEIKPGEVARTYPCDPSAAGGMINLNFDAGGVLIGIEIIGARRLVPASVLEHADRLD